MFGVLALALAMSGVPALALAESNGGQSSGDEQKQEVAGQGDRSEVKGSNERNGEDQEVKEPAELQEPQEEQESIELEDENDTAVSLDDLKQKIENRKQELDNEEASTTPKFKDAMKNANEVRLAVHALLASKDLIGGIGQQVSEIAKEMNRSVASTTNAEARCRRADSHASPLRRRQNLSGDNCAGGVTEPATHRWSYGASRSGKYSCRYPSNLERADYCSADCAGASAGTCRQREERVGSLQLAVLVRIVGKV